jgi:hypothetical protein
MSQTDEERKPWTALILVVGVIGAIWWFLGARAPKLLGQSQEVDCTRATISWRTGTPCFSLVEYWASGSGQRARSQPKTAMSGSHEHVLSDLKPGTSYGFQLLYAFSAGGDYRAISPVEFVFVTIADIRFSDIAVDPGPQRAEISWTTNIPTDTVITIGPPGGRTRQVSGSGQQGQTHHRLTVQGLEPGMEYRFQIVASDPAGKVKPMTGNQTAFSTSTRESRGADTYLGEASKSAAAEYAKMTPEERAKAARSVQDFIHAGAPSHLSKDHEPRNLSDAGGDFDSRMDALRKKVEEFKKRGVDVDRWLKNPDVEKKIRELEQSKSIERLDEISYALDHVDEERIKSFLSPPQDPPALGSLESAK